MEITFTLTGGPASEPVSAEAFRTWARLDDNDSDASLEADFLLPARHLVEQYTGRTLKAQTWTGYLRAWPDPEERDGLIHIRLAPYPASITSVAVDGAALDSALYELKGDELIVLAADLTEIPEGDQLADGILITFTSAVAATSAPPLLQAIKLLAAHAYENREPMSEAMLNAVPGLAQALYPYRVIRELN